MKDRKSVRNFTRFRERGAALIAGLVTTMTLTLIAVTASKSSLTQMRMANNYRFSIEAMTNAEAGIAAALSHFDAQTVALNGFDDELDPNGDGSTADRFSIELFDPNADIYYTLVAVDDDDGDNNPAVDSNGVIQLMSQGSSAIGSVRAVEVRISATVVIGSGATIDKAVLAEESIILSGNSEYFGSNTDIHSNNNIYQSDKPITPGTVSASGRAYGGDPIGGGTAVSGADTVSIPHIRPSDFGKYADYVFQSDGSIYDSAGNFQANASGFPWRGWKFTGDVWTTEGDRNVLGGFLYFEGEFGNVNVASNPGTAAAPWEISILADGYIELSGNPIVANHKNTDDPADVQSILFMAGTDVKINGNASQTFSGLIAAAEQFDISGNPTLDGSVLSGGQDNSETNDADLVRQNSISGQAIVNYSGSLSFPATETIDGTVNVLSWRDREIPRNSGVFATTTAVKDY